MAQQCLVCGQSIDGHEGFYQHHLNQCLDGGVPSRVPDHPTTVTPPPLAAQPSALTANTCPAATISPQAGPPTQTTSNGSDPSRELWVGHDKGKHQIDGSKGLVQVIGKLLEKSHAAGKTEAAFLSDVGVEHVARGLIDITWGCGYRNAQMLFTSLRNLNCYAAIHPNATGSAIPVPTILELQTMIEHAWTAGHDPDGAKHFKFKLRKSIRWVGTTEIYTAFTWLGIRVKIVDFPRAKKAGARPAHDRLIDWLKDYFTFPSPPASPTSLRKRPSPSATAAPSPPITPTARQPVYLQHSGHSRTVVGIESGPSGEWLLVFDPGKNVDGVVRKAGQRVAVGDARKRAREHGGEANGEGPKRNGFGAGSKKSASEEQGLVTERYEKLLDPFRVSLKKLARHDEYQIMYVEEGPLLTAEDKKARRFVKSTVVE